MNETIRREPPIRVSLVDDDDLVRSSLSVLIGAADGFACVGAPTKTRMPATSKGVLGKGYEVVGEEAYLRAIGPGS